MENKPNVFPDAKLSDAMKEANDTGTRIAEQAKEELNLKQQHKPQGEIDAEAKMKQDSLNMLAEQLRLRDELRERKKEENNVTDELKPTTTVTYAPEISKPQVKTDRGDYDDSMIELLSRPQENAPFDVIKIPSEGLLYKNGKSGLKVAYLNASDENIITNPSLLKSGKFLEILLNRKILDPNIRYNDLHVGDRNAIMIWLRATGYGPMYKITLSKPNVDTYEEFDVDIDLSKLPTKYLTVKPDTNGHFDYKLPISNAEVKFKLLTVGDIADIDSHIDDLEDGFVDASTFTLKKQIIAVNNDYDVNVVSDFVDNKMRIGDVRSFRQYVNEIESGIDLKINVGIPGGGSLDTFLPLNLSFFWPDLGL